eukprot:scaffold9133_cov62-Phaeocystis_antarctica.AAC.4
MQHLSFAIGEEAAKHHGVTAAATAAWQRRDNRLPEPRVHCIPEHGHPSHADSDIPSGTRPAAIGADKRILEGERRLVEQVEARSRVPQGEHGATELSARLLAIKLQQVRTAAHVLVPAKARSNWHAAMLVDAAFKRRLPVSEGAAQRVVGAADSCWQRQLPTAGLPDEASRGTPRDAPRAKARRRRLHAHARVRPWRCFPLFAADAQHAVSGR